MDYVPSTAAISAATQKLPVADAMAIAAGDKDTLPVVPEALDPRSIYAMSAQAADAMLSLIPTRSQPLAAAEFNAKVGRGQPSMGPVLAAAVATTPVVSPETTKTVSAANRNWNEDVRLDHSPFRRIGSDTVVKYDNPRVMAAWRTAFPNIREKDFRGLRIYAANFKNVLSKLAADGGFDGLEKDIYLLCDSDHFRVFTQDHPDVSVNWINVDDEDVLLFWPKNRGNERNAES